MIKTYRLKKNYKNYKKGNLIYWDEGSKVYKNHELAIFKRVTRWSFCQLHVQKNSDIFEPVKLSN